jgi:hypothetical protein
MMDKTKGKISRQDVSMIRFTPEEYYIINQAKTKLDADKPALSTAAFCRRAAVALARQVLASRNELDSILENYRALELGRELIKHKEKIDNEEKDALMEEALG